MKQTDSVTVRVGKGGQKDAALSLASRLGVPLSETDGEGLTVLYDAAGVSLTGYGLTYRGDFSEMLRRVTEGRLQHEMLVRAAKTKEEAPTAVDATAGMGEDSFLLAAAGYTVTLFEQDPVVAALLKDALRRAKKDPVLREIAGRMKVIEGDSVALLPTLPFSPDLIYLDPMFPERQKSGLIGKKLQLIQKLESPCSEEEALLSAALAANPKKLVIKRPLKGPFLAGKKPDYSIEGKAIRYDCIILQK